MFAYASLCVLTGLYKSLCVLRGSYGFLRICIGPDASLWILMDGYVAL